MIRMMKIMRKIIILIIKKNYQKQKNKKQIQYQPIKHLEQTKHLQGNREKKLICYI